MSYMLLGLELLFATTLFAALFIALAARRKSRLVRYEFYTLGVLLPSLPLVCLILACGGSYFFLGLSGANFWGSLLILLAFVVAYVVILIKATRRDAAGLHRAWAWSPTRISVGFLVAFALLVMTYWNLALQAQIEIQAIHTQAGALALSVAPPVIPDSENAALVYRQAGELYEATATANDKDLDYKADPKSPQVTETLQRHQKTLEVIRRATDLPGYRSEYQYASPTNADLTGMIKESGPLRAQANLLVLAARAEAANGQVDQALDDCRRLYAISAHVGTGPLLINALVSVAIDGLASKTTAEILPYVTAPTQLERLPKLDSRAMQRVYNRCLRTEEAFSLARFGEMGSGEYGNTAANESQVLAAAAWMLWLRDDMMLYRENLQRVRDLVDQPYFKVVAEWKQIEADGRPGSPKRRGMLAGMLLPSLSASVRSVATSQALREDIIVTIAATRYRLAHNNQYPESAQALVPEFLDSVPLDPFDGKSLRLLKTADAVTVYSVGEDLADNGGQVDQPKQGRAPDTGFILKPVR